MTLDLDRLWDEAVKDNGNIVPSDVRQLIGEVRRLRATMERVRALADEWESDPAQGGYADALFAAARDLRAALAHPKENA
jgi:hypothetical protein